MLGRQFTALGEAAAGEDVSVGRAHVAFVRTVFSYTVEEGFYGAEVLGVGPMGNFVPRFPGFIEYSLGRTFISAPV